MMKLSPLGSNKVRGGSEKSKLDFIKNVLHSGLCYYVTKLTTVKLIRLSIRFNFFSVHFISLRINPIYLHFDVMLKFLKIHFFTK